MTYTHLTTWKSISNAHDIDIFFADPGVLGNEVSKNILMAY